MIKKITDLFSIKDALWTNILKIFSSSILTSAISFGLSPIITRVYSTEAFGVFAVIFAASTIISELITLKYERAIILPDKTEDAYSIFWLSAILSALFSIILLIPLFLFKNKILQLHESLNSEILIFIPFLAFTIAVNTSLANLANKLKLFNQLATNRIVTSVFLNILIIAFGYLSLESLGLVVSYTMQYVLSSLLFFITIKKSLTFKFVKFETLKYWALRYVSFPKYYLFSVGIESIAGNLPNFFFMKILGPSFLGNYNLSNRIVKTPMGLIGNAMRTVFNQAVAEAHAKEKKHLKLFIQNFKRLLILGILPVLIIVIFGPQIFSIIFGEAWKDAGEVSRYLAPVFLFQFVSSPLSVVITVYEKINIDFFIQCCTFFFLALCFFILWKVGYSNFIPYLVAYNAVYCIKYFFEFSYSYWLIKQNDYRYS